MDELDYTKPTEEFLRSIDVHELLPQQEPFVMISRLTQFDMLRTVTETTITENNIFVGNGCFTASGLIENIAQTCAARIGYVNKYILKKGIQIGFIGALRNLQIHDLPKVNDTITTTVDVQEEIFGMTLANSTVQLGKNILLTGELKIALKKDGIEG
ncbi:MAG: pseudouridylate synthase [Bacteroidaceae bacterium]|nr:pseudouridylate synthase [Bacteroidaceae bacterium]